MDPLLQQIISLCHTLNDLGLSFTLVCFLGHLGIKSNEEADAEVINVPDSPEVNVIAMQPEEATATISVTADMEFMAQQTFCIEAVHL